MEHGGISAQLYTVRQYTQTPDDLARTMHRISEIGFRNVEAAGTNVVSAVEFKKMLDDEGLFLCCTHTPFERLQSEWQAVVEDHKLWNCPQIGIPSMPQSYRDSAEGFRRFAREASEVGQKIAEQGLRLSYHNHSFEFVRFGDKTGLDIILEESDPRYLVAQIDTYWVQHGGGDPAAWIRKAKNRTPVVHMKDMIIQDGKQVFAEVGEGNLNWPAILQACREAGVQFYVVEQDICQRDCFESIAISFKNMKAMGL